MYEEQIPTAQLVQRVATVMQEYTQSGGVRPFGVSLLIAGWDDTGTTWLLFSSWDWERNIFLNANTGLSDHSFSRF